MHHHSFPTEERNKEENKLLNQETYTKIIKQGSIWTMNVRVFSGLLEMDVLNLQNRPVNKYHKTLQSAICNYLYLLMFRGWWFCTLRRSFTFPYHHRLSATSGGQVHFHQSQQGSPHVLFIAMIISFIPSLSLNSKEVTINLILFCKSKHVKVCIQCDRFTHFDSMCGC